MEALVEKSRGVQSHIVKFHDHIREINEDIVTVRAPAAVPALCTACCKPCTGAGFRFRALVTPRTALPQPFGSGGQLVRACRRSATTRRACTRARTT